MDINKYTEKKQKGLVKILSGGKVATLSSRRFDPETGEETEPEIITFGRDELLRQKETYANLIKAIDALLGDIDINNKPK